MVNLRLPIIPNPDLTERFIVLLVGESQLSKTPGSFDSKPYLVPPRWTRGISRIEADDVLMAKIDGYLLEDIPRGVARYLERPASGQLSHLAENAAANSVDLNPRLLEQILELAV